MKIQALLFVALLVVTGLSCGCLSPAAPESPAAPLAIQINATPPRYSPVMSSTIGIRLTPVNTSGIIPSDASFTWETDFGTFYHWGPPDFKVVELAPTYTGTAEPVYWSYFSQLDEKYHNPVNITLAVTEPSSGKILASAILNVGWEDPRGFIAIVEG